MDSYSPVLKTLFNQNIPFQIHQEQVDVFYDKLVEINQKLNLTRIVDRKDFDEKHLLDAWALFLCLPNQSRLTLFDVGTGGGIPGIPIWLAKPQWKINMIDSVNKKLNAINEISLAIHESDPQIFKNMPETTHGRAEDLGQKKEYREQADVVVSRAVARLNTLLEYCLPFVKYGGTFIAMKGPSYKEELASAKKAAGILGAKFDRVHSYQIADRELHLLVFKKLRSTPRIYPRQAGTPKREPLA